MGLVLLYLLLAASPAADYDSASRKLSLIESGRARPSSTVVFSHREVNEYARQRARQAAHGAIREPRVVLRRDGAVASALVDFARLREAQGDSPGRILDWLLSGERPVEVALRVQSAAGWCRVDVERVELSGIAIDGRALDFLVEHLVRPSYPDLKLGEQFELDHNVERIDVRPTSVFVRIAK